LVAGTGVAQAVPIVFAPILTRLYGPQDFGVAALYLSLASILGVLATFRYEAAILQPKDDLIAFKLVKLCIIIATTVALLLMLLLLLGSDIICRWLGFNELGTIFYFLPLSMVLTAIFQSYNYWAIRRSGYLSVAIANTVQSTSTPSVQVVASSFTNVLGLGLVVGNLIGQSAVSFFLYIKNRGKSLLKNDKNISHQSYFSIAKEYKQMPLFGLPGAILDTTAVHIPIMFMTKFFENSIVGFFSLVFRVLNIPARLFSGVLSKLLLKKLSNMSNSTTGCESAVSLILKSSVCLILIISPLILIFQLWGEELFAFVFGEDWKIAGTMASILVFAIAIRFIVSPLSSVLALKQHIRKCFYWQLLYIITLSSTLIWVCTKPLSDFLFYFVVHEVILYVIYYVIIVFACYQMDRRSL